MSCPDKTIPKSYTSNEVDSEEDPTYFPYDAYPVYFDLTVAFENPITYYLIHSEVNLPQGEKIQCAKFIGRKKYPNGENVGKYNDNQLFNSMLYGVGFPYNEIK